MSLLNVLNDFPYRPRYYLTRPWRFFQECWWNVKAAWARATKGVAYRDSAEMDEYLLHIIPIMLREIANGEAYPGNDEFPTYESWKTFCCDLANKFEMVQQERWEDGGYNEYEEEWEKTLEPRNPNLTTTMDMTEEERQRIRKLYWEREKELWVERQNIIEEAYNTLAKYHGHFWI